MKFTIGILYHGAKIENRFYDAKRLGLEGNIIDIDIGILIDVAVKHALDQAIGEPPHPSNVDWPPPAA